MCGEVAAPAIDGGKPLRKAVREVFGKRALVQRCQVHKKRNVLDQLPDRMRASVSAALSQAYASRDKSQALRLLNNLERRLGGSTPARLSRCEKGSKKR